MTPDTTEWRSSTPYDYMDNADVDALAWECLRRNLEYQRDYADSINAPLILGNETEAIGNRWGLRFPRPAKSDRHSTTSLLDAGNRHQHTASRTCADAGANQSGCSRGS
ncbi:transcriptional regulator domain-containing protein [Paracoccus aminovorans]|uniref:transcriptional regulator domain-containing protein n=1 Tax=Paracoccus aminovorans TaxID=34004 RepID=UPI0038CD2483